MEYYFLPLIVTFLIALIVIPIIRTVALRYNIVDRPQQRKLHKEATPLLGGLAIFISFCLGLLLFYKGTSNLNLKGVVLAATCILIVGYFDDRSGGLNWRLKLLCQMLIALMVVVFFNIRITFFNFEFLNIAATIFWITMITNSLNLLDNMDGLAAGIAGIAALFYGILAHKGGQFDLAMFSLLLAVSAFAFLKYNFSPASMFMGDMGSMFLGLTLGCIAIQLQVTELWNWRIVSEYINFRDYQFITGIIPILVLALPVFDTALVSILRIINGLHIYTPGKDHSSHRLTHLKGKIQRKIDRFILAFIRFTRRNKKSQHHISKAIAQTRSVLILYAIGALFGLAAIIISQLNLLNTIVLLFIVVGLCFFGAKKLADVAVYEKK